MPQEFYTGQWDIRLRPRTRGFHLVTDEVLGATDGFGGIAAGICQVFLLHTSASLTLNENSDPDVRTDMETIFNRLVPEGRSDYVHTFEGSDDMPAHAKSSILGSAVSFPVRNGWPLLGTWQGIYLCEHRDRGGSRHLCVTVIGTL
ncbi:MAG: YjbQ family protein [Spirochaetaceae bacterium]|nr:MAG: YjbQ family protein [Spirochaetaceae bacterium]